ncbi:pilus assembly protein [Nocardioides seonyuensis]|uniref:Pilus assembly protein n=1 Tax=Nocardioides seonyuensis TaxID=2518371 RepID=A0A4P7IIN8_9ACTN|nr:TadE family protein [Nocardioides seonyuensis]QBX57289.1 pilus assembly protein [Nocardioides seonyuensis]
MTRNGEGGAITIWLALTSVAMMLLVGLAVDLGGQVHAQQRAHDLAAQAARAGGEQVQAAPAINGAYVHVDAVAASQAARAYLTAAHVDGTVAVSGSTELTVEVNDSYSTRFLGLIGINNLPVTGSASARLVRSLGGTEQ